MMNAELETLWQQVVDTHSRHKQAYLAFLNRGADRVGVLRKALRGSDRLLALRALPALTEQEKKDLLPEWVNLARCAHSYFEPAWNVIASLPRTWVLEHIAPELDAILANEEETDYWMFLQLAHRIDPAL